jgi:hypothetical protein
MMVTQEIDFINENKVTRGSWPPICYNGPTA